MRDYKTFDCIRIVHTNKIWQDNESGWCIISVYDGDDNLITSGHDVLRFEGDKGFMMDCHKDQEGFTCYSAKFELELGYNTLTIIVK
jgi:hypothetical protein